MTKLQLIMLAIVVCVGLRAKGQQVFLDKYYTDGGNLYTLEDVTFSPDSNRIAMAIWNSVGLIELNEVDFTGTTTNSLYIGRTDCTSGQQKVRSILTFNGDYWLGCYSSQSCFDGPHGGYVARIKPSMLVDSLIAVPASDKTIKLFSSMGDLKVYSVDYPIGFVHSIDSTNRLNLLDKQQSFWMILGGGCSEKYLFQHFEGYGNPSINYKSRTGEFGESDIKVDSNSVYSYTVTFDGSTRYYPIMTSNNCNTNRYYFNENEVEVIDTTGVVAEQLGVPFTPFGITRNAVQKEESVFFALFSAHQNFDVYLTEVFGNRIQTKRIVTELGYQLLNEGTKVLLKNDSLFIAYNVKNISTNKEGIRLLGVKLSELLNTPKVAVEKAFEVYPNPAHTVVNITLQQAESATISVFTMSGSLAIQEKTNTQQTSLNVANLPEGVYVLTIETQAESFTQRIAIIK